MKITGISVFYSFVQAKIVKLDSSFLKESFHEQEKKNTVGTLFGVARRGRIL